MSKSNHFEKQTVFSRPWLGVLCLLMLTSNKLDAAETRILFGSDIHSNTAGLAVAIDEACVNGLPCETVALVGDYNTLNTSPPSGYVYPQSTINDITGILDILQAKVPAADKVLASGNHDWWIADQDPMVLNGTGLVTESLESITSTRPIFESSKYDIWVIDYVDFTQFGNPTSAERQALEMYFQVPSTKTLFILSHYPLHTTRDENYDDPNAPSMVSVAESFFAYLNEKGTSRNIVYLWGHNHHSGYDTNVNLVARPGDQICGTGTYNNSTVCNQSLTFTYLNAGYITNNKYTVVTLSPENIQVYRNDLGYNLGDVNHDTVVNILDALIVSQVSAGQTPNAYDAALADVNDNGTVNIIDALIIAQYATGLVHTLPHSGSNADIQAAESFFFGE